jgi:Protein of unknown function (DUF2937)
MFRHYLRLVIFTIGLLIGVQAPGFVDQYVKRVSAHYTEAKQNFNGFQQAANQYFNGDVDALVAHHLASTDPVFKAEAKTIADLFARIKALADELDALKGSLLARLTHIIVNPNRDILQETLNAYSYTVPLSPDAILYGVSAGLIVSLVIELILAGLLSLFERRRWRAPAAHKPPEAPRGPRREPSIVSDPGRIGRR